MKLLQSLKALAEESRLKIITLLLQEDHCVRSLAHRLDLSEAAISQHLKVLRVAGLVQGEKRGYWVHYQVQEKVLADISKDLKNLPEEIEVPGECQQDHRGSCCQKEN